MTQQPLNYANWQVVQPKKRGRGLFAWVLFIGLAVMLFMLLNTSGKPYKEISLSDFQSRLLADEVRTVQLSGNQIYGAYTSSTGQPVDYRVNLPEGMGSDWGFIQWILNNRHSATVSIQTSSNVVMNILVPLIPWILIFGFIWFFVFRNLRQIQTVRPPSAVYLVPPPPGHPDINPPPPPISGGPPA